ncbi:MAG: hypothetical protein ACAI18_05190 [Gemmatimonadales bacterium]
MSAAVLMAWGCGHTEPFASPPYGSDAPFDPTPPQRLTYNDAADRYPSWLSDGSGLLYSSQQTTRLDADLCAALLPPTGGTQRELWCDVPSGGAETDAIESPVVGADGQLAFVGTSTTVGGLIPIRRGIAVADTLDPASAQMVRSFPYTPAGSTEQFTAEGVRWLDPTRVVYLGQQLAAQALCLGCPVDTLRSGQAVTILDLGAPGSLPVAVPGTATATGVAVGPSGDALLYTLAGDSRVYRFLLASGTVQVAHDFGAAGVVRDIQVVGSRMAAVVGGRVAVSGHPALGSVQYDSGGVVHVVDLNSGEDVALDPADRLYRRPALSPLGDRLAVEGYPLIITSIAPDSEDSPPIVDTTVGKSGDIYLFGAP